MCSTNAFAYRVTIATAHHIINLQNILARFVGFGPALPRSSSDSSQER